MIERFTKEQFEQALPTGHSEYAGMISGEHCYHVRVKEGVNILVRSSIDHSGIAGAVGEDSIRLWLVDKDNNFLGSKISRWVTRQPGWDQRLLVQLRQMWYIGRQLGNCQCGGVRKSFKVKKEGPNKGKIFVSCNGSCKYFEFLEDKTKTAKG